LTADVTRGGHPKQQQPINIFNQQGLIDRETELEERIMCSDHSMVKVLLRTSLLRRH